MVGTDKEIWEGIKADNKKAFELLFNRYYNSLCLFANSFLNNHSTSEEITIQVFFKIWHNRERIQIKGEVLISMENKRKAIYNDFFK